MFPFPFPSLDRHLPYLAVLISSLLWAIGSNLYAQITQKVPIPRLNFYKGLVVSALFLLLSVQQGLFNSSFEVLGLLICSGVVGFAVGDLLLLKSFSRLGTSQTLLIASLEPGILAVLSYVLLGATLSGIQIFGSLLIFLSLYFLAKNKTSQTTEGPGKRYHLILLGICGVALDSLGVGLSKKAFLLDPQLTSAQANTIRVLSATLVLWPVNLFLGRRGNEAPIPMFLKGRDYAFIALAAAVGTFLPLYFYLFSISQGHPAVMSALGLSSPIFSAFYEFIVYKSRPTPSFLAALICMGTGVMCLLHSP